MNTTKAHRADHEPSPTPALRADHEVSLVRWPDEAALRDELAIAGRPRLLLVADGVVPPLGFDALEDWIRLPARPEDLAARREALRHRSLANTPIHLDGDGLLHRGRAWVALPPVELRLFTSLYERQGLVVGRSELRRALGPSARGGDAETLDTTLRRVRRRVRPLGVVVRTVPRVGFVLELTEPEDQTT